MRRMLKSGIASGAPIVVQSGFADLRRQCDEDTVVDRRRARHDHDRCNARNVMKSTISSEPSCSDATTSANAFAEASRISRQCSGGRWSARYGRLRRWTDSTEPSWVTTSKLPDKATINSSTALSAHVLGSRFVPVRAPRTLGGSRRARATLPPGRRGCREPRRSWVIRARALPRLIGEHGLWDPTSATTDPADAASSDSPTRCDTRAGVGLGRGTCGPRWRSLGT